MRAYRTLATIHLLAAASLAGAQSLTALSRADALRSALDRGGRLAVARADTSLAAAQLLTAKALPNPALSASYSKSVPELHLTAELPIDYRSTRNTRIRAAEVGQEAAGLRFAFERASVALDADTAYTRALGAIAHVKLSARDAVDADSLLRLAVAQREAGDVSDFEVELATVNAAQQANAAAADSIAATSALLDLQAVIGLGADHVAISPTDSLTIPPGPTGTPNIDATLPVSSAAAFLQAAELGVSLQQRSIWGMPSILFGFETRDPSGAERGILPTVGFTLPFPIFDKNRGPIAEAEAERNRSQAELDLARVETQTEIARATRERVNALAKVARDSALVATTNKLASMSLAGYREGALTIPMVLAAQRTARESLGQYIDDLVDAWIATAELRAFQFTPSSPPPR